MTLTTSLFQLDYGSKIEREIAKVTAAFEEHKLDTSRYPRRWLEQQQGFRARANAAQANGFEAFPFFAAAVIVAHLTQAIHDDSGDHILAGIVRAAREAAGKRKVIVAGENEPQ